MRLLVTASNFHVFAIMWIHLRSRHFKVRFIIVSRHFITVTESTAAGPRGMPSRFDCDETQNRIPGVDPCAGPPRVCVGRLQLLWFPPAPPR